MKKVDDFFNKLAQHIDKAYFPNVKYYRDDQNCANCHYAIELFNNGQIYFDNLITRLAKETKGNITDIVEIVNLYLVK